MYDYKTILIGGQYGESIYELNSFYSDGWEFVNATAEIISTGGASHLTGGVYFTIRKQI